MPSSKEVAWYDYTDEHGKLLYQCVRFEPGKDGRPKDFRQRRPNGNGGWIWNLEGVRYVLYRLQELLAGVQEGKRIYVCEGEKDVDRLRSLDLVATCCVCGANAWRDEYAPYLKNADVVVLPDNDDAGVKFGRAVAHSLTEHARSIRVLNLPGLGLKRDVSDWLDAGNTKENLADIADIAEEWKPEEFAWEPLIPFEKHDLPSFPTDALPLWLRNYVEAVAESIQAPVDLAAMLGLSVLSLVFARKYEIQVKPGYIEPLNLYTVTAMLSGSRKSAVCSAITKPVEEYEAHAAKEQAPSIREAKSRRVVVEKRLSNLETKASKEEDGNERENLTIQVVELCNELDELTEVEALRLLADDVTQERLVGLMSRHHGRMAILSPEGGLFGMIAGRYSQNKNDPNVEVLLKAHAGETLRVDRVGRPPEHIENPALTLGLTVQPGVIQRLAEQEQFGERGLLARFLYSLPASLVGRRNSRSQSLSDATVELYREKVFSLLSATANHTSDSKPITLRLEPVAFEEWIQFDEWLEPQRGEGGEFSCMAGWAEKLSGAVARIAGLLHLASCKDLKETDGPVRAKTMEQAIEIAHYLIPHAKSAYAEMGLDRTIAEARHVTACIRKNKLDSFSKKELFDRVRGRFNKVANLEPVLELMTEHGFVRLLPQAPKKGPGQPKSPRYEVNPELLTQNTRNSLPRPRNPNSADSADLAEWCMRI